ncbi:hypothetical protein X965_14395 [Morganella sp. EGD-HP17]|nr:hypothetical protein X965_14395 [Morganella sp. EGD-HP17]
MTTADWLLSGKFICEKFHAGSFLLITHYFKIIYFI